MAKLTNEQAAQYFHRSYASADGLWFMKVEERRGFDEALEIDKEVWKVVPKIQARMLKSMLNTDTSPDALLECFSAKLDLEGFEFEARKDGDGIRICIAKCPWHGLMVKSGRGHLSEKVNGLICGTENAVWASEFGRLKFERESRICKGDKECVLRFLP
ncbi:MAG TPA: DUF6125 family protein [Methanotrichaceae archaeon]|nr:DUF6125 family protein [Methanotrichaceae archaeon]